MGAHLGFHANKLARRSPLPDGLTMRDITISTAVSQTPDLCIGASNSFDSSDSFAPRPLAFNAAMRKSGRMWSAPVSGAVIRLYDCGFVVPSRANCCPWALLASST